MASKPFNVLLVEDSPSETRLIAERLGQATGPLFELHCAEQLPAAMEILSSGEIDVVLLDLTRRESQGLQIFQEMHEANLGVPIVVLVDSDSTALSEKAVEQGAQDYLVKGQVDADALVRSLRYAIERQRLQTELQTMALDDLTGLYNRRTFLLLADRQMLVNRRSQRGLLLLALRISSLQQINIIYGHREGNRALVKTASLLRKTFRASDIVARWSGNQFIAMVSATLAGDGEIVLGRFQKALDEYNAARSQTYQLALSMGAVLWNPTQSVSLGSLIIQAEQAMLGKANQRRSILMPSAAHENSKPLLAGRKPSATAVLARLKRAQPPSFAGLPRLSR